MLKKASLLVFCLSLTLLTGCATKYKPTILVENNPLTVGQWNLTAIQDLSINETEDTPFLNFEEDGKITGYSGCNQFFSNYSIELPHTLDFLQSAGSLKMCEDMTVEDAFLGVLEDINSFSVSEDGQILSLGTNLGGANEDDEAEATGQPESVVLLEFQLQEVEDILEKYGALREELEEGNTTDKAEATEDGTDEDEDEDEDEDDIDLDAIYGGHEDGWMPDIVIDAPEEDFIKFCKGEPTEYAYQPMTKEEIKRLCGEHYAR